MKPDVVRTGRPAIESLPTKFSSPNMSCVASFPLLDLALSLTLPLLNDKHRVTLSED